MIDEQQELEEMIDKPRDGKAHDFSVDQFPKRKRKEPYWVKCNRCCDTCMNNLGTCCLYSSLLFVLFVIPITEIVQMIMYWNNYGGCSVYFQYLLLSKLLITLLIYTLGFVHYKYTNNISKIGIIVVSILLLLCWCIIASIVFFDEDSFDETHCNAHDAHTAGYYDFMYVEVIMVYVILSLVICGASWFIVSQSMSIISAGCIQCFGCTPMILPILEVIVIGKWWNNYGDCPEQFQSYILAKLLFTAVLFVAGVALYGTRNKRNNNTRIWKTLAVIVFVFYLIWMISAWAMFFDPNGFDHDHCNHHSAHTAIYYDFMLMEIVIACAVCLLLGSMFFWLGMALLCPVQEEDNVNKDDM